MDKEEIKAQTKRAKRELKERLSCHKAELDQAVQVMNYKASVAL